MDVQTERDNRFDLTRIERDVDEACDRFEAAWCAGARPLLEDFLGSTTDLDRDVLLRHLVGLELDYLRGSGESPRPSEYRRRFPEHAGLIDSVFAESARRFKVVRGRDEETLEFRTGSGDPKPGSPANPPPDAFPSIPGFEIISELGRGGMGVVYKARQIGLNRLCALKMLLLGEHAGAESRARFLAEAEIIARLKHPNVVQIYSLGDHDGRPYFEMEYVEGGSLARRLDGTPWALEAAARMVAVLARAIGDAHRLGIVHRDLKPANVLLVDDDTPKVVDFGLAKSLGADSNLTQSGIFVGTPSYAAPEQVEGLTGMIGPAADIYALGAIFYQMLTGRPPFQAPTVLQTLEQVKTADPVPPSRLQPGLSRDAETICMKCLQKDPQRRYADAAALAEDLDRVLAGRPILARPVGAAERLRKWIRRRPAVAMLSAAVVAVTVLGFILVSWQWRCAEARAIAEAAASERAHQASLVAIENEARLAFHQAQALCDQGEVGRGLLWLARSLELATEARSTGLDRVIRINLADWATQLIRPRRLPPMRHSQPIVSVACRREGRSLVSVGTDGVSRTWDTATGRQIEQASSKCADDDMPNWWDETAHQPFAGPPEPHGKKKYTWAVSSDGRTLVTAGRDRRVVRWDVATKKPIDPELHLDSPVQRDRLDPRCSESHHREASRKAARVGCGHGTRVRLAAAGHGPGLPGRLAGWSSLRLGNQGRGHPFVGHVLARPDRAKHQACRRRHRPGLRPRWPGPGDRQR